MISFDKLGRSGIKHRHMAESQHRRLMTSIRLRNIQSVFMLCVLCWNTSESVDRLGFKNDYSCDNFPDYGAYMDQWWQNGPQISAHLYPYGPTYCDQIITRENDVLAVIGFDPRIEFTVPYYGKLYNSLWISPNGFISLQKNKPANPTPFIWLDTLPNHQYPTDGALDPPMIAPFYAEANMLRNPPEPSAIAYRKLDPSRAPNDKQRKIMEGTIWDISTEIRSAVVGADKFQATHGLVVTWHQVTFDGNDCTLTCARNTYQVALMTDGTESYTVFSYQNVTWIGGVAYQGCDRYTGTRTSAASNCKPAHTGFNAGEGRWFHALPYSNQDILADVDVGGGAGSNVTGRYYYKVSDDTIVRGGCTNDTTLAGVKWAAEIFPSSGGMLGGVPVNISGPCFTNHERLKCRFDGHVVDAIYVNNIMRVTCIAPTLDSVGPVKIGVSIDGGNSFVFETDYIVVTADHITPGITVTRQNQDWLDPGQMELLWTPAQLTPRQDDRVDIKLYGYREDTSSGTPMAVWEELHLFADDYSNTGVFTFNPESSFVCQYNQEGQKCTLFDVGAFQINIDYPGQDPANPRRIWSEVFPLGWYIKDGMTQDKGDDWISYKCEVWYNSNYKDTAWYNDVDPCPCTFDQAYTDFGRFQPDPLCTRGGTSASNCNQHQGAVHSVISVYSSPSGSGSECSYDSSGQLMYSGDSQYGSRPHRSHVWGAHPYKTPPRIPNLSHWQWDLTGLYYCCQWQSSPDDCHKLFIELRRTKGCEQYVVPGQAMAFGDPHFLTFDGVFYTFNGYGEFWLMKVEDVTVHDETVDFKLHGRFEQPANQSWGATKATYMTAVGMQLNNGNKVVVELNRGGLQKKLLVNINNYLLDLTEYDLRRLELEDLIIMNNDPVDSAESTNFTIVYRCGFGVNAVYKNGLIHLTVSAPPEFETHTHGLLGKWNGDPSDDLTPQTPGGPIFDPHETENIHNSFGLSWMVTNTESCFQFLYRVQLNHAYYNRYNFVPNYEPKFPPNNTDVTEEMVQSVCGGDLACTFDYKATLNAAVGQDSLDVQKWDQQRREMGQTVTTCGWLAVPYSTKAQPISYLAGSMVTITGCISGYTLEGPTQYTCEDIGDGVGVWSPDVTTLCRGPDDPLPTTTILAIAIPVALVGVLLIIGIIVIVLVVKKKRRKKQRTRAAKQALADVIGNPANGDFSVVPPTPERKQKPPRPELNLSRDQLTDIDDSVDLKHHYENKMMHSSDESAGNHVSWDTQDGEDKVSDKPIKVSTLKSNKSKVSMDPSPTSSPKTKKKKKRPYQYPNESRENSQDEFPSYESPSVKVGSLHDPVASYKPRDVHSYTKGHNIPTSDNKASNYYMRKYGRYGAGYNPS